MTRLAGGPPALTRRGVIASRVLIGACFALAAVAGATADVWNPISRSTVAVSP